MTSSIARLIIAAATVQFASALSYAQSLPHPSPAIPADIKAAIEKVTNADVSALQANGVPTFIKGKFIHLSHSGKAITEADLGRALNVVAPTHRLKPTDLSLVRTYTDDLGYTHARYSQTKNGLPVVGAVLDLHVDKTGDVYAASGNAYDGADIPSVAKISADEAIRKAESGKTNFKLKPSKQRLAYVVATNDQSMHLAYEVEIEAVSLESPLHELVYVDAISGTVVDVHSLICNDNVVAQYDDTRRDANNNYIVWTVTNPPTDPSNSFYSSNGITGVAQTDFVNEADTYSFYLGSFGRSSYDGAGGTINTYINAGGNNINNAFMDPTSLGRPTVVFGAGDQTAYGNFANALDVTAHEYTHAVTYKTSGLIYANEPGALNEAMSDILGTAAEVYVTGITSKTWKIGSDICLSGAPHDAIRYMDNPTNDGQSKDFYPDRLVLSPSQVPDGRAGGNDDGYVHLNSGIANLAFKLLVTGGTHPRAGQYVAGTYIPTTAVPKLDNSSDLASFNAARAVFYRANTVYLTPGAQFMDARAATVQAAQDLGYSTTAVSIAWDVVGVPAQTNRNPINISARAQAGTGANTLIAGFVLSGDGSAKNMLIRGVGPALTQLGVSGALPDPQLALYNSSSTQLAYNDDWSSSPDKTTIAQTASAVGAFALPDPSKDSAMIYTLGGGAYTAQVSDVTGQNGTALVEVYDTDASNPTHLVNISARVQVTPSSNLIAGFVINGSGTKYLLIRAVGPGLGTTFGLSGVLPNPRIQLYSGSTQLRVNSNWTTDELGNSQQDTINQIDSRVGAFPLHSSDADAAMLVALPAGSYTAVVTDVNNNSGIAMIEVYEVN